MSKVIWQKAASPNCHSSRLQMNSSDIDPYLIHGSLNPRESPPPNGISIGSSISTQYLSVANTQTDRHTDHATCHIYPNRPHLRNACDAT